jgi:UDP-N-acetylmuramate dehydrogenase
LVTLTAQDLAFGYRRSTLEDGWVLTRAVLRAEQGDPEELAARMADQLARRNASQPTKDLTAGSTFRNPAGFSSTGRADDIHDLKAWAVIDKAGLRGHMLGAAQMSPKHPNFLVNTGGATAADLEALGEFVRKRVFETQGIELDWEVVRIGAPNKL